MKMVSVFLISFWAGVIITLILTPLNTKISEKIALGRLKIENKAFLKRLMNQFIELYNQYEKLLDLDVSILEFMPLMHNRGITTESALFIPLLGTQMELPVWSVNGLIVHFFISGEYIFSLGEKYNNKFNNGFEQIDNYKIFAEKFLEVKKRHDKIDFESVVDVTLADRYYLAL